MLKTATIDSLKLRLPKGLVQIVDPTFAEEYQKIYINSGFIEEEVINLDKHKVHILNGITTRIGVAYCMMGTAQMEQIFIQVNAKQLQEDYFQGITIKTIFRIYEYIMDLNIIYVDFPVFMSAYASDVDVCYDLYVTPKDMQIANNALHKRVLPSLLKYVGDPFRQKQNTGLQFNERNKATAAKPYVKIYHKGLELEFKSVEFAQAYLKGINYTNLGRLEFTIKNKRHKDYLGIEFTTLEDLLAIPEPKLREIVLSGIPNYIDKTTIMKSYSDLSPTDRMIIYYIEKLVNSGADRIAIERVLEIYDVPQEKSRMKKKLNQLLDHSTTNDRMIENKGAMNFLRDLDLDF